VPRPHAYDAGDGAGDPPPLDQLRAVLDELAEAGVLSRARRPGMEYAIWSTVHGLAVLTVQGPLRNLPDGPRREVEQAVRAFIDSSLAEPPRAS
jgi:hypothetical protein